MSSKSISGLRAGVFTDKAVINNSKSIWKNLSPISPRSSDSAVYIVIVCPSALRIVTAIYAVFK